MHILKRNLVVLCLFFQYILVSNASREGSTCSESEEVVGKCRLVKDCPLAIKNLKETGSTGLSGCGFVGFKQLVCCPTMLLKYCKKLSKEIRLLPDFQVFNGTSAEENEFPHMAAVGYEDTNGNIDFKCGASIITENFLLTAAHCVPKTNSPTIVRIGVTKLDSEKGKDYSINETITHSSYNFVNKQNDIALIKVNGKMSFNSRVYPACLYFENDVPDGLIVSGWGKTSYETGDDRTNILQKAILPRTSLVECKNYYLSKESKILIDDTNICTGSEKADSCRGDSGGPLQIKIDRVYHIVGIVSTGLPCAGKSPGVNVNVFKYIPWIESTIYFKL